MSPFKAIENARVRAKKGGGMDPGWAQVGKKMDQLVEHTSLVFSHTNIFSSYDRTQNFFGIKTFLDLNSFWTQNALENGV